MDVATWFSQIRASMIWVADDGSNEERNAKKIGWHTGQALFPKKR